MPALDRPRLTDETPKAAECRQSEEDRKTAKTKLLALAGAVADLGLRHRLLEAAPDRRPLLRVWDPRRQALGETVACHETAEGWKYSPHPFGSVICSAEGIKEPGDATDATRLVAELIGRP